MKSILKYAITGALGVAAFGWIGKPAIAENPHCHGEAGVDLEDKVMYNRMAANKPYGCEDMTTPWPFLAVYQKASKSNPQPIDDLTGSISPGSVLILGEEPGEEAQKSLQGRIISKMGNQLPLVVGIDAIPIDEQDRLERIQDPSFDIGEYVGRLASRKVYLPESGSWEWIEGAQMYSSLFSGIKGAKYRVKALALDPAFAQKQRPSAYDLDKMIASKLVENLFQHPGSCGVLITGYDRLLYGRVDVMVKAAMRKKGLPGNVLAGIIGPEGWREKLEEMRDLGKDSPKGRKWFQKSTNGPIPHIGFLLDVETSQVYAFPKK